MSNSAPVFFFKGGKPSMPFPVINKGQENQWEDLSIEAIGKSITDLNVNYDTDLYIFLPRISQVAAIGGSISIRKSRLIEGGDFGIFPHWDDIVGYWGRRISYGAELARFSLFANEAGNSCVLTPREVSQIQIHYGDDSGTLNIGQTITGSEATGEIIFIDTVNKFLQLRNVVGNFINGEAIIGPDFEGSIIHDPVDCTWMWEVDFVTGGFSDEPGPSLYYEWW